MTETKDNDSLSLPEELLITKRGLHAKKAFSKEEEDANDVPKDW